jgi:hydrogenase maturation protease
MTPQQAAGTLIVGFGNEIRRDDGIGPCLVRVLTNRSLPGVSTKTVHQLLPELAAELAGFSRVIFVDADANKDGAGFTVERVQSAELPYCFGHMTDVRQVLAYTQSFFGRSPEAWLVSVTGDDFGWGQGLSAAATANVEKACESIVALIARN